MVKSNIIYWVEDRNDESIELEDTLTFNYETAVKYKNNYNKRFNNNEFVVRQMPVNFHTKNKYKK